MPEGIYNEDVSIYGFVGGMLTINLAENITIQGSVDISDCARVYIAGASNETCVINPQSGGDGAYAINIISCRYVSIYRVKITGYAAHNGGKRHEHWYSLPVIRCYN